MTEKQPSTFYKTLKIKSIRTNILRIIFNYKFHSYTGAKSVQ